MNFNQTLVIRYEEAMLAQLTAFEQADKNIEALKEEATRGLRSEADRINAKMKLNERAVMKTAKDDRTDARLRVLMYAAVVTALKGQA